MSKPVAVFYPPECHLHDTGSHHPENARRLEVIKAALEAAPCAQQLHWHQPEPAPVRWIDAVHAEGHRHFIEEACLRERHYLDQGDTTVCAESYRAALLASGAALGAVDAVFRDGYGAAFSCARPPGHHATPDRAMGFCLFNHIAVAARYAQSVYKLDRVCILDWDVHHGNGTQDIFYADPSVLFCSLHQFPLYPHSGDFNETGRGAGEGFTINCPMPNGSAIEHLLEAMNKEILPELERFQPQLMMISAGFDAHREDPLADLNLESKDFATLTHWVQQQANRFARGRIVSILEGGYNLEVLGESVAAHLGALVGGQQPAPPMKVG